MWSSPISVVTQFLLTLLLIQQAGSEYLQEFEVRENVPIDTVIGLVGFHREDEKSHPPSPPYIIVPVASDLEKFITVSATTGEIRTNTVLDRESRSEFTFTSIPLTTLNENDNPPEFHSNFIHVEFAENAPRDSKRTLAPARDRDLGQFNTQSYQIISGNTNNAFKLPCNQISILV